MIAHLVATKYRIPPLNPARVARSDLLRRLEEGIALRRPLTLVSAPAGYGKTTLLAMWASELHLAPAPDGSSEHGTASSVAPAAQQRAWRCAWLTLDAADNDPAHFLVYLIVALQQASPKVGQKILGMLQSRDPPAIAEILPDLVNDVSHSPCALLVVLDDYHYVAAQPVHDILAYLLKYAPANFHLVISTRIDPPLALARLRGRAEMTELRQRDLRFTPEEAAILINTLVEPALDPALVAILIARTEGWAAGLQLAALSLRRQRDRAGFVHAFSGSHRHIFDYLSAEVFETQQPEVQRFLLRTSILDRLCSSLCSAVLDEKGMDDNKVQEILEKLDQDNLFVVALDEQRDWYRYHHLFAELLRQELDTQTPELTGVLHHRASIWYEEHGLRRDAIEHSLASAEHARAAHLIAQAAESTMMSSEVATLRRWIEALPPDTLQAHPVLDVYHAGVLLLQGEELDHVEQHLRSALSPPRGDDATGPATIYQALLSIYHGDVREGERLAHRALALLPVRSPFFRSFVSLVMGINHLIAGNDEAATNAFTETIQLSDQYGNLMNGVMARSHLGELYFLQGRLRAAKTIYDQALEHAVSNQHKEPIAGLPLMGLGLIAFDRNELQQADYLLNEAITRILGWGEMPVVQAALFLARVKRLLGQHAAAERLDERVDEFASRAGTIPYLRQFVNQFRMRQAFLNGDRATGELLARQAGLFTPATSHDQPRSIASAFSKLSVARFELAQGHHEAALEIALVLEDSATKYGRMRLAARAQIVQSLAQHAMGRLTAALGSLGRALAAAAPEGSIRLFIDEGAPMAELLALAVDRLPYAAYIRQLLAAYEAPGSATDGVAWRSAAKSTPAAHKLARPAESDVILEPLSPRELDVIRLMAAGLSNRQIARRLGIAVSTVKSHVHAIFRKLSATRRTQAVARARASQIL